MKIKEQTRNVLEYGKATLTRFEEVFEEYYTFLLFTTVDKEPKKRTRPDSVYQKTSFVRFL